MNELSRRIVSRFQKSGAFDSLLNAKVNWAVIVAEAMSDRFQNYGGWKDHRVATHIRKGQDWVALDAVGESWAAEIRLNMSGTPTFVVEFDVTTQESDDLLEVLTKGRGDKETFVIDENKSVQEAVMTVSLWLSKKLYGQRF